MRDWSVDSPTLAYRTRVTLFDQNQCFSGPTLLVERLRAMGRYVSDFFGAWYSGWYNGFAKKRAINVPWVNENIHNVIVSCKAHKDVTVIEAIDTILKAEKN